MNNFDSLVLQHRYEIYSYSFFFYFFLTLLHFLRFLFFATLLFSSKKEKLPVFHTFHRAFSLQSFFIFLRKTENIRVSLDITTQKEDFYPEIAPFVTELYKMTTILQSYL